MSTLPKPPAGPAQSPAASEPRAARVSAFPLLRTQPPGGVYTKIRVFPAVCLQQLQNYHYRLPPCQTDRTPGSFATFLPSSKLKKDHRHPSKYPNPGPRAYFHFRLADCARLSPSPAVNRAHPRSPRSAPAPRRPCREPERKDFPFSSRYRPLPVECARGRGGDPTCLPAGQRGTQRDGMGWIGRSQ